MIISFAPFSATLAPYKQLQDGIFSQYDTNLDFIIYQTDDGAVNLPSNSVAANLQLQTNALVTAAQSKPLDNTWADRPLA